MKKFEKKLIRTSWLENIEIENKSGYIAIYFKLKIR